MRTVTVRTNTSFNIPSIGHFGLARARLDAYKSTAPEKKSK
jgi:hypothetical protein